MLINRCVWTIVSICVFLVDAWEVAYFTYYYKHDLHKSWIHHLQGRHSDNSKPSRHALQLTGIASYQPYNEWWAYCF